MTPPVPRAQMRQSAQGWAGFTLFESVIVLIILGVLAVIAAPKAFNTSSTTLDMQARTLASDLQRAQLLATTQGQMVLICPSTAAYLVQIGGICPSPLPTQTLSTQPVLVTLSPNAELAIIPPATALPSLSFNSMGKPNGPADFKIRTPNATSSFTVSVADLSGLVSIAKP